MSQGERDTLEWLKRVVPEVGLEPTRTVKCAGF